MKITFTRLLDTARYLQTKVGEEIPDFFEFLAEYIEQTTRSLRTGLSFGDNFNCEVKTVSLKHDTETIISASKTATGIIPVRAVTQSMVDSFGWWYSDAGNLTVRAKFSGSPTGTIDVVLVILF